MKQFVRTLLRVHAAVDRDRATEIARQHASANGWPWVEPIRVSEGITRIHVMTNASYRGGNANIWIDVATGKVVSSAYASR